MCLYKTLLIQRRNKTNIRICFHYMGTYMGLYNKHYKTTSYTRHIIATPWLHTWYQHPTFAWRNKHLTTAHTWSFTRHKSNKNHNISHTHSLPPTKDTTPKRNKQTAFNNYKYTITHQLTCAHIYARSPYTLDGPCATRVKRGGV